GADHLSINVITYNFFRSIRSTRADYFILLTTLLGQKEVLIASVLAIVVILLVKKRYRLASHFALLLAMTAFFIFVLKNVFHSLRPWGILHAPDTFSMPSGHATLSFALFLGIAYFAART